MTPTKSRATTLSGITAAQIDRLQSLAEQLGYVAKVGGSAGSGSVSALVRAIADGELVITKATEQGEAVRLIVQYGQIDGAHHKAWVLDQALRLLADDEYDAIVTEYTQDGEYDWDTGIAP